MVTRLLTLSGALAAVIFFTSFGLLFWLSPSFSVSHHYISELGAVDSPIRLLTNITAFIGAGLFYTVFGLAMYLTLPHAIHAASATLLIVGGIFFTAIGFAPCDPGCVNYSPAGRLHEFFSDGFLYLGLASIICFIFAEFSENRRGSLALLVGVLAAVLVSAAATYVYLDTDNLFSEVAQKLAIGIPFAIMGLLSLIVYRRAATKTLARGHQRRLGLVLGIVLTVVTVSYTGHVAFSRDQMEESGFYTHSPTRECPDSQKLQLPVPLNEVTHVLWPGQERGGDFKAHGGFRFDESSSNDIVVRAPLSATLVGASRYLQADEVQYLLIFESDCGLSYRFDHILTPAFQLQDALAQLPPPRPNDSRTTDIKTPPEVTAGDPIGVAIGFRSPPNVFVDFGLYETSGGSKNGLCFFNYFKYEVGEHLRLLPAGSEGKDSAYCGKGE